MSLLLVSIISILGVILGKLIFEKWFNHLTLYCVIFGFTVFLYELKLLPYPEIIPLAWIIIAASFLSFLLGILTIVSARNVFKISNNSIDNLDNALKIFYDDGKTLKYVIIFLSLISLLSGIQYWMALISKFGSIPSILLHSYMVYRLNVNGELDLKGLTPYIFLAGYIAVFFAGIYTAYKGKFTFLTFFPIISIIIREIAAAGRAGMLIALMEFAFSFFLFRHLLNNDPFHRFRFSKKNAIIASILLIVFFVGAASVVRLSRAVGNSEDFMGASRELRQTKGNFFISPSVYLYASSEIGVLSKYLASKGEHNGFGENTFLTFYQFLAKCGIIKRPVEFEKGYYIPMWTNTGTYLRELHADFGVTGVVFGPLFTRTTNYLVMVQVL